MKNYIYILLLKSKIRTLNRKRDDMILSISVNQPNIANRVASIEDAAPNFFKEIDKEIALRERMIRILKGKPTQRLISVSMFL